MARLLQTAASTSDLPVSHTEFNGPDKLTISRDAAWNRSILWEVNGEEIAVPISAVRHIVDYLNGVLAIGQE